MDRHELRRLDPYRQNVADPMRRTAWLLDNEPGERPELAASAFVFIAEEAAMATTMAVHIQGGLGISSGAATAYLVRARGWPLAGGDPAASAERVASLVCSRGVGGIT